MKQGQAQVEGGQYTNDSEYIRDLIRREQFRQLWWNATQVGSSCVAEPCSGDRHAGSLTTDQSSSTRGKIRVAGTPVPATRWRQRHLRASRTAWKCNRRRIANHALGHPEGRAPRRRIDLAPSRQLPTPSGAPIPLARFRLRHAHLGNRGVEAGRIPGKSALPPSWD